jgi:type II secretory pathway pseudopilin PulG
MSVRLSTSAFATVMRRASWVGLGLGLGVGSFAVGALTCLAAINDCSWIERHAGAAAITAGLVLFAIGWRVLRLPAFDRDLATWRSTNLAALLLAPWLLGVLVAGPTWFGTLESARERRTMADMRTIAEAFARYQGQHGRYPEAGSVAQVARILGAGEIPEYDGWGNPFLLVSGEDSYTLVSHAKCGRPECDDIFSYEPGMTTDWEANIVLRDGRFIRCPEGLNAWEPRESSTPRATPSR